MKVLLLAHSDPPIHGQAVAARALVDESREWRRVRLYHINTVYADERGDLGGLSLRKLFRLLRYLTQALHVCRSEKIDMVIYTQAFFRGPFLKDAVVVQALSRFTRARLAAWIHMDPARLGWSGLKGWFRRLAGSTIGRVDHWVACAPALLAAWPDFVPASRRVAVANGIDAPACPPRPRPRSDAGSPLRVVYLSAMDPEKGWQDLLAVIPRLAAEHPAVEFHFYGNVAGATSQQEIEEAFARCGLPDRVRWLGPAWGEAKWRALADADLLCFPSHTEQFPIAVLDAMASGLPVVATRVGAVADAIEPGAGGWLVPARDSAALEEALREALSDRSRLERYGARNRETYESRFTRGAFGRRWEDLITEWLSPPLP